VTVPEESGTEQSYRLEVEKVRIGSRRVEVILNDFGITIAETRGACVIAIFWTGQKWAKEQDGPRKRVWQDYRSDPVRVFEASKAV
jgi:hypothetical protein